MRDSHGVACVVGVHACSRAHAPRSPFADVSASSPPPLLLPCAQVLRRCCAKGRDASVTVDSSRATELRETTQGSVAAVLMSDSEGDAAPVVCAIAHPLADAKLAKKVLKVVKKGAAAARNSPRLPCGGAHNALASRPAASKAKCVRRGVKEVVKALRKQPAGCVALALACAASVALALNPDACFTA